MTFGFMRGLSESRLFPMRRSLRDFDAHELADIAYLSLIGLRICLSEPSTTDWAQAYCRKTARGLNFQQWRGDGTDIYIVMHALTSDETGFEDDDEAEHLRQRLALHPGAIYQWIVSGQRGAPHEDATRRLFTRFDALFRVQDASMRSIRRLAQDWPDINEHDKRLVMTRLLQILRARASRSEILPVLVHLASHRKLELTNVCDPETGDGCDKPRKHSFLSSLGAVGIGAAAAVALGHRKHTRENATSGGTSAASVATCVGGIGAGFDHDYSKSVYPSPVASKKPRKMKVALISRLAKE